MAGLKLVHDVLDLQLVDRANHKVGRVDGLMLALVDGQPPRVAAILVGGPVRAERIGRWMKLVAKVMRAVTRVKREGVSRIPFSAVRCIGDTIRIDVDGNALEADHLENWLKAHVVSRIPGAGAEDGEHEQK
jgi:hypothetical protein